MWLKNDHEEHQEGTKHTKFFGKSSLRSAVLIFYRIVGAKTLEEIKKRYVVSFYSIIRYWCRR